MGFFQQFPSLNIQQLNIDWVLDVVHRAESLMKNLNTEIENVVRPMINEQDQFYQRLVNDALTKNRQELAQMGITVKKLERDVKRQLYDNTMLMQKTTSDINVLLSNQTANVDSKLSKALSDMSNTLSYFQSLFNSQAQNSLSQNQQLYNKYKAEFEEMAQNQTVEMAALKLYVHNSIMKMQNDVTASINTVNNDMSLLKSDVVSITDSTLVRLSQLGDQLLTQVKQQQIDLNKYYESTSNLLDTFLQLFQNELWRKVDITTFKTELDRLEKLIIKANADIMFINPSNGEFEGLQKILYDIYGANNPLAITAGEYDSLGLRASQYDALADTVLTAYNYDYYAKWYLILYQEIYDYTRTYTDSKVTQLDDKLAGMIDAIDKRENDHWDYITTCCSDVKKEISDIGYMYNPMTGVKAKVKDVVAMLFNYIANDGLTAKQYDDKAITAQYYDGLMLTAFTYDWYGANYI